MPRRTRIIKAALIGLAGFATAATIYPLTRPPFTGGAGFTHIQAYAPLRDQNLDVHMWYPADAGGRVRVVGGNGVFHGTPAGRDAPAREGAYPLVVISHGGGGNAGQLGWIAAALARNGYVVALPNHPGSTSGNSSAEEVVKVWTRPPDLSAVIDEIVGNPDRYPNVDVDRVATLGFSYGGYTAMALSGAIVDPDRLQRFCDDDQTGMSDCTFLANNGIDLHQIDLSPADTDHRDPRLRAAVVIDPGIISTVTQESLGRISIPMLVMNLGDPASIPPGVDASGAATHLSNGTYVTLPGANHFSFLAECKPKGADILAREGEIDPLCDPSGPKDRMAYHAEMVEIISTYLAENL